MDKRNGWHWQAASAWIGFSTLFGGCSSGSGDRQATDPTPVVAPAESAGPAQATATSSVSAASVATSNRQSWPVLSPIKPNSSPEYFTLGVPNYLQWIVEPRTEKLAAATGSPGTLITRISDSAVLPLARTFSPLYSKKQQWNVNGSKVLMWAPYASPSSSVALLNGDYSFDRLLPGVSGSHFWLNTDPDKIVTSTPDKPELRLYSVSQDRLSVMVDFSAWGFVEMEYIPGGGEGNPSNDDRYWPIGLKRADGSWHLVIWDRDQKVLTTRIPLAGAPGPGYSVDWHGMSQSGNFLVTGSQSPWDSAGRTVPAGINVWNRDGDYLRTYYTAAGGTQGHVDLGIDAEGRDVLVYLGAENGGSANDKFIATWRLDGSDGGNSRRQLTEGYLAGYHHISCRNLARPGWCVFSTFSGDTYVTPMLVPSPLYNHIFAVPLDGSGRVAPIANIRHSNLGLDVPGDYDIMAFATPNRDLSAVMYRSVWDYAASRIPGTTHAFIARQQ